MSKISTHRLDDGWILFRSDIGQLVVLSATGKVVWDLLAEGYGAEEIGSLFAQSFGISVEQASDDVAQVICALQAAAFHPATAELPRTACRVPRAAPSLSDARELPSDDMADCGTFRFGQSWLRVCSAIEEIDADYFSRFRHRAAIDSADASLLEISGGPHRYRLALEGDLLAEAATLTELAAEISEFLLRLEYPDTDFLAYFHAGGVARSGKSLLLPGISGAGKSTLTAYLVANGFAYLGDDVIAIAAATWSPRPVPTCLSLKSGSWPILEHCYPTLPHLPTVHCRGRRVRYLDPPDPEGSGPPAPAPSAIVFPSYSKGAPARLHALSSLQTMIRLIESNVDLQQPASETTLLEFLRFVEQTPAFELSYSDLKATTGVLGDLLENSA